MTEIAGIEDYAYAYSPNFRDAGADHPYWGDRGFTGSSAIPDRTVSERHYISPAKKNKRMVQEEGLSEFDVLEADVPTAKSKQTPKVPLFRRMLNAVKDPYFREDFGFNIMNYVLVPASAVVLFVLYVYAETMRSMGY